MPITYDISKDGLYLKGKREGKKEEKEKSKQRTKEQIEATKQTIIERMLKTDQLTVDQIAEIVGVSVAFVQSVQQAMNN